MRQAAGPVVGILQWFWMRDRATVEEALTECERMGITHLRTGISWADWLAPGAKEWFDWLLPKLAERMDVLPCFTFTPPSLGVKEKTAAPPRDTKAFADFLDEFVIRYGQHFDTVELWNEPNNLTEWDWTLDREWFRFADMIVKAAYWMHQKGKKTVLGGMSPIDPNWLRMMFEHGALNDIDVVGVHGFPGAWEAGWEGWDSELATVQEVLNEWNHPAKIWITETGYSTWRFDDHEQVAAFELASKAPVERVYWYSLFDLEAVRPSMDGFHVDQRDYHFGLLSEGRQSKLLHRILLGAEVPHEPLRAVANANVVGVEPAILITGGAGFVGTNVASRLAEQGRRVRILDNLSRPGVEKNLTWLHDQYGSNIETLLGDVRNRFRVGEAMRDVEHVYHFAAQVAVTSSVTDPRHDFEVNAMGTFNVLEAARDSARPPSLLMTSTNKVYGDLADVRVGLREGRYEPEDAAIRSNGVPETRSLDFHSPYGCSKGTADQYVLDYGRSYGLSTIVFRMSCIYGPHQFGTEDQGWVAHFLIRALQGEPITLYGDGRQVRDVLFVEDLVEAMETARVGMDRLKHCAFNIGGGSRNTVSLLELISLMERLLEQKISINFDDWRIGDQRYYVSDTRRFKRLTGWSAETSVAEGVEKLCEWLIEQNGSIGQMKLAASAATSDKVSLR